VAIANALQLEEARRQASRWLIHCRIMAFLLLKKMKIRSNHRNEFRIPIHRIPVYNFILPLSNYIISFHILTWRKDENEDSRSRYSPE